MGQSRKLRALALPAALVASAVLCVQAAFAAPAPDSTKRIEQLPPLRWDATGEAWSYATEQHPIELARVMNGLTFGMTPEEVSRHLPGAGRALHWADLPRANEFRGDVRYVWLPMQGAAAFRSAVTACFGDSSYIVLLFGNDVLFRASFRFMPSEGCADPHPAAEQLYGTYTPLAGTLAVTVLYHTGDADVVDVTDPAAGPIIATRWQMRAQ